MRNYLSEMLKRKDLLLYLVKSGLKAENRNSYLGYFWWLLDPLLNVVVYYFLVVVILGRGGEDYAVFLVIGLVSWRWINTTINTSAKSRSEEHTSELQSRGHLVCRLLLEKKNKRCILQK